MTTPGSSDAESEQKEAPDTLDGGEDFSFDESDHEPPMGFSNELENSPAPDEEEHGIGRTDEDSSGGETLEEEIADELLGDNALKCHEHSYCLESSGEAVDETEQSAVPLVIDDRSSREVVETFYLGSSGEVVDETGGSGVPPPLIDDSQAENQIEAILPDDEESRSSIADIFADDIEPKADKDTKPLIEPTIRYAKEMADGPEELLEEVGILIENTLRLAIAVIGPSPASPEKLPEDSESLIEPATRLVKDEAAGLEQLFEESESLLEPTSRVDKVEAHTIIDEAPIPQSLLEQICGLNQGVGLDEGDKVTKYLRDISQVRMQIKPEMVFPAIFNFFLFSFRCPLITPSSSPQQGW